MWKVIFKNKKNNKSYSYTFNCINNAKRALTDERRYSSSDGYIKKIKG